MNTDQPLQFEGMHVLKLAMANFFGQQSKGIWQLRGSGRLMLSSESLFFRMFLIRRELRIYVAHITGVELVTSHLKKTQLTPLLKVLFTNEVGQADSAAWRVVYPQEWKTEIEQVMQKRKAF